MPEPTPTARDCTKCERTKPLTKFSLARRGRFGRSARCKTCDLAYRLANKTRIREVDAAAYAAADPERRRAISRDYYVANRERVRAQHDEYRSAHREEKAKQDAAYYAANRERLRAQASAYRAANLPEVTRRNAEYRAKIRADEDLDAKNRAYQADYRAANLDQIRKIQAAYYLANYEKICERVAAWRAAQPIERLTAMARARRGTRRARELDAQITGPVLTATLMQILAEGECVYCGDEATDIDHIRPLKRGGWHHASNLVAACAGCNRGRGGKHSKLLTQWDPARVARAASVSPKVATELARQQREELECQQYGREWDVSPPG